MDSLREPADLLRERRRHTSRLANEHGSTGERKAASHHSGWEPRPTGAQLKVLLEVLALTDIHISGQSFDYLEPPDGASLNYADKKSLEFMLSRTNFIEVKTATASRVDDDFGKFFFALTEKEILASEQLKERYVVILFNSRTERVQRTTVQSILKRSRSTSWQVSVQL